jgi:hypothetical protein
MCRHFNSGISAMISSSQDLLRPSDAASFSASAHSADMVSPNRRLCVTTSTGAMRDGFLSRDEVEPAPGAGSDDSRPIEQPAVLPLLSI